MNPDVVTHGAPKQFVEITGEESLFQASARRLSDPGFVAPTIITAADFRFVVIEQLAALEIIPADILIEPAAKNTAAAICAAWARNPAPDRRMSQRYTTNLLPTG